MNMKPLFSVKDGWPYCDGEKMTFDAALDAAHRHGLDTVEDFVLHIISLGVVRPIPPGQVTHHVAESHHVDIGGAGIAEDKGEIALDVIASLTKTYEKRFLQMGLGLNAAMGHTKTLWRWVVGLAIFNTLLSAVLYIDMLLHINGLWRAMNKLLDVIETMSVK